MSTCANCGYNVAPTGRTELNPAGDTSFCPVCKQPAVHLIAVLPNGKTMPDLPQEANTLTLRPELLRMLADSNGHAILEWYDGEYTQLIYVCKD